MTRAAVVGHIEWVDFVPVTRLPRPGEVIHADGAFTRAAGGGGVAAGVLAELGAEVHFFTALGDDGQGRAAADQLAQRGGAMERGPASRGGSGRLRLWRLVRDRVRVRVGQRSVGAGSSESRSAVRRSVPDAGGGALIYIGWRTTGRRAAPASSSRRTGVVSGAVWETEGSSRASRRM